MTFRDREEWGAGARPGVPGTDGDVFFCGLFGSFG
jgi:hypothetical protein